MRRSPYGGILRILALSLFAASCTDGGDPTALGDVVPQSTVTVTYEAGGGGQFAFLQPLVKGRAGGDLATGLSPIITICNISSGTAVDCVDLEADQRGNHYQANWKDKTTQPNETYSIEVFSSFGLRIGSLELLLDGESGDKAGRTFPIKFWIGEDLGDVIAAAEECIGDDRCNADDVPDGSGTIVITTENESGATMAQLTFPEASVPEGGLVVTLDCRQGGFAPTQGPLPTSLNQWPLFCEVTASNPDGSPFVGTLPDDARLDQCIVDENLQPACHGFPDHDDLVLGQSDGPGDFVFLEKVPSIFAEDDCALNTTVTDLGLGDRILHELDQRLAPAFGVLLPEDLRAAPMWFRDGGVGGLIRSFSDVNPVEPAYISGTVSHVSGGIDGVTVTLSGDAAAVAITGEDGHYQFGPLQAAPGGGSSYTVTVTPPAGETFADPDVDVVVTGTGTTTVDFVTSIPAGFYYYPPTGNYYRSESTPKTWTDARDNAAALPAFRSCSPHLATILTAGEDAFVVQNMPEATAGPGGGHWLGGFQLDGSQEPGGGWKWISGELIPGTNNGPGYANWAAGEPNNVNGGVENALQYTAGFGTPPTSWNDEPDSRTYGSIIEYSCDQP